MTEQPETIYSFCEREKVNAIKGTTFAVRIFSVLNIVFDIIFTIAGLVIFKINMLFILAMLFALTSTLYVFMYADQLSKFSRNPERARSMWFWENNALVWRYALFKVALVVTFIAVAIIETARIDVVHVLLNLDSWLIVISCLLFAIMFIMVCVAAYIIGKHHRFVGEMFIMYDATDTNVTPASI